jgi:hypothetical protein
MKIDGDSTVRAGEVMYAVDRKSGLDQSWIKGVICEKNGSKMNHGIYRRTGRILVYRYNFINAR